MPAVKRKRSLDQEDDAVEEESPPIRRARLLKQTLGSLREELIQAAESNRWSSDNPLITNTVMRLIDEISSVFKSLKITENPICQPLGSKYQQFLGMLFSERACFDKLRQFSRSWDELAAITGGPVEDIGKMIQTLANMPPDSQHAPPFDDVDVVHRTSFRSSVLYKDFLGKKTRGQVDQAKQLYTSGAIEEALTLLHSICEVTIDGTDDAVEEASVARTLFDERVPMGQRLRFASETEQGMDVLKSWSAPDEFVGAVELIGETPNIKGFSFERFEASLGLLEKAGAEVANPLVKDAMDFYIGIPTVASGSGGPPLSWLAQWVRPLFAAAFSAKFAVNPPADMTEFSFDTIPEDIEKAVWRLVKALLPRCDSPWFKAWRAAREKKKEEKAAAAAANDDEAPEKDGRDENDDRTNDDAVEESSVATSYELLDEGVEVCCYVAQGGRKKGKYHNQRGIIKKVLSKVYRVELKTGPESGKNHMYPHSQVAKVERDHREGQLPSQDGQRASGTASGSAAAAEVSGSAAAKRDNDDDYTLEEIAKQDRKKAAKHAQQKADEAAAWHDVGDLFSFEMKTP